MKHRRIGIASFLLLALSGCQNKDDSPVMADFQIDNPHDGTWQDSPEVPFRFILEQTFGVEDEPMEELLSQISSVATDDSGNVYILDNRANRIVSFDDEGKFKWRTGREGEGPGELRSSGSLFWDGIDKLYFTNQLGTRIEIFGVDGTYLDSHLVSQLEMTRARIAGFLAPDSLVLYEGTSVPGVIAANVTVVSVGDEWSVISRFVVDQTADEELPNYIFPTPLIRVSRGELIVGHDSEYRYEFFKSSGELIRIVTRAGVGLVRPGYFSTGVVFLSTLRSPFLTDGDYWLTDVSWNSNVRDPDLLARLAMQGKSRESERKRTIDIYDRRWRLLYAWTREEGGHNGLGTTLHADASGKLYLRMIGDFPQVGRYRVEVDVPN